MGVLEIFLLVAGAIILVGSFLLPQSEGKPNEHSKKLVKEEIKALVAQEMEEIKGHVDDVVDEAVGYAVEKTERSLERLSNEKIMAVNEYSDTVLQEIHKNHEEVMFLYDMLNSKHANLKNTVSEINKTVKEAAETTREAESAVQKFQSLKPETIIMPANGMEGQVLKEHSGEATEEEANVDEQADTSYLHALVTREERESLLGLQNGISEEVATDAEEKLNQNDKILELYKQGKSAMAIAKKLGMGVGEVKLVINLYKNA